MTKRGPLAVAVAGATGLVGSRLLKLLAADDRVGAIHALARRVPSDSPADVQWHSWDWLDGAGGLPSIDAAFCCLGTTRREAGSRQALEAVDHGLVLRFARAMREAGAGRLALVSSVGASSRAMSHYLRVKGRVEDDVRELGFDGLAIVRPSLLLGSRAQSRPAEDMAQRLAPWFAPLLRGPAARYRPITAEDVAQSLCDAAFAGVPGVQLIHPGTTPASERGSSA